MNDHVSEPTLHRGCRRYARMSGRDPQEPGRSATPLELLYDLTFVVAIGLAAHHYAELLFEGHPVAGTVGFLFGMFGILNAWIDYSWFSSAFDTDDWAWRLLTMVQMVGVVIIALGLAPMFHSLAEEGDRFEFRAIAAGYVVMRIAHVLLWVRVIRESDEYDEVGIRNAVLITVAQVCWVLLAIFSPPVVTAFVLIAPLVVLEVLTALVANRSSDGTPWHGHHIAERYGLLAIIALGEGVVGTVASSEAAIGGATGHGWDLDAVLLIVAGIGLTFAMWWNYFQIPFGDLLHHRPRLGFLFGYGHLPVYVAIAAMGGGLHIAALNQGDHGHGHTLSDLAVLLTVAVPYALFLVSITVLESRLLGRPRGAHLASLVVSFAGLVVAGLLAPMSLATALLAVMLAAFVPVIGFELSGYRHQQERLVSLTREAR